MKLRAGQVYIASAVLLGALLLLARSDAHRSLEAPLGYALDVYARGLEGARSFAIAADGTVIVATHNPHRSYVVSPPNAFEPSVVMEVANDLVAAPNNLAVTLARATSHTGDTAGTDIAELMNADWMAEREAAMTPEGALLVADHEAGILYRVTRRQ